MKKKIVPGMMCFVFLLGQVCINYALNPNKAFSQYIHDAWDSDDRLPYSHITAVIQTGDGYIWVGTQEGLARFDGVRFTVFDKNNTPELKGNYIENLFEDRQGNLWIDTTGGLTRFKNGEFFLYSAQQYRLPDDYIRSICGDRQGDPWIAFRNGISHFKNETFVSYTAKDGMPGDISYIYEDPRGCLWIGTQGNGLYCWQDKKMTVYNTKNGLPGNIIGSVYEDRKGNLWIGTQEGLCCWRDGKFTTYTTKDKLSGNYINRIYEDRWGKLWVGTYGRRLNRWDHEKFSAFTIQEGLTDGTVNAIAEDREGSLWIGTEKGLNRLRDGKVTTVSTADGLPCDNILRVYKDSHQTLWLASRECGIIHWQEGKSPPFITRDGLSGNYITSIGEDKQENLWISDFGQGLYRLKDGKITTFATKEGLSENVITSIDFDSRGTIWIGTLGTGINWLKDGKIIPVPLNGSLAINNVKVFHEDKKGGMWIGAVARGLFRWHNGTLTNFTTNNGLSSNTVLSIHEDSQGTIWIGTYEGGLSRWKDNKITTYTSKDGLFNDNVYHILEDENNNLWMSCNKGIYTINKKQLDDYTEGKINKLRCTSYDKTDGMKSSECSGGSSPSGCKTRDGKLCFPTNRGLVIIDPENIHSNTIPPPVMIEDIMIENRVIPLTPGGKIHLGRGTKDFEIRYTALSFLVPKKVRFKYQLEGFNDGWVETDTRRTAYFTNIPPGDYRFRVIACNNDGFWNREGAYFDFYLRPYFYQTWWFYPLVGLMVLLSGVGFYGLRVKQMKKREAELKRIVEDRTHQLGESNKELEKLSIVARETDNGVMIMDTAGNIRWVNENFIRMFSGTLHHLPTIIGRNLLQVSLNPNIRDILNRCLKEKKTIIYEGSAENREGKKIWTQTALTPVIDENGNITQLVTVDSDVTGIKEAETAAEKANQSKSDFLARMSHEIRTPMNGVIGFTEMLLETKLNNEQIEYVKTIYQSGETLLFLLDDILDFSKIEAGELSFDPIDFDPEVTAFDVCNLILPRINDKPIEVLCRIGDDVPAYVKSDAGRFRQVLVNLIGNAVKFTEKGEIELSLELMEETEKKIKLLVKVRDTGIGIPADKIETIFNVFQQADQSITRKYGGTGLGMAICKQIAAMMGGDVRAESQPEQGSTFYFTSWMEKSEKTPEKEVPREYLAGKKILIVDDNQVNLEILSHTLETAKLRVVKLSNPDTVIEMIKKSYSAGDPFALGIIDIQMPVISGYDMAKQVRRLAAPLCHLPLLAFSSSTIDRSGKFKGSGFNAFLPKPIQRKKLLKMIESLLGDKGIHKEKLEQEETLPQYSIIEKAKHSIRILLAEDNPVNQKLADFMLSKAGYQLTIVSNGKEAVETYTAVPGQYDLIFMDLQMPEMGGIEATRLIREQGFKEIPIIAMTAESMMGASEKCLKVGMNDYISKPIKREIVFEMVKKWCLDG
ncbi:two-component regulator propeller domain-containing protein [Acidobacteriota bacterium]